jgi:hypothetical protein
VTLVKSTLNLALKTFDTFFQVGCQLVHAAAAAAAADGPLLHICC